MKTYIPVSYVLAIFVHLVTSDSLEETKATIQEDFPYLVSITYNVKIDKIPKLIEHVIVSYPRELIDGKLSLQDFCEFIKIQNITLDAAREIVASLKLEKFFTLQESKHLIDRLNISISDVYHSFISTFKLGGEISKAFEVLQIDSLAFLDKALAKKDEDLFKVILNGTYTKESVGSALEILKLNESSIFQFIKPIVLEKLANFTMWAMLQCFEAIGAEKMISTVIKAQKIDMANISDANIRVLIENFDYSLKRSETMGVRIEDRKILTHMDVYLNKILYEDFVDFEVEDVNLIRAPVDKARHSDGNAVLELKYDLPDGQAIPVNQNMHSLRHDLESCSYISGCLHEYTERVIVPIANRSRLGYYFQKTKETKFRQGSPLICKDFLYGLASYETEQRIYFTIASSSGRTSISIIFVAIISSIFMLV